MTAVQDGPTSITVTWTASSDATGYRIHYTSDSDSGSETVSDGSTETHTMTGLVNGETYTISILASSLFSLPSESVTADMTVGLGNVSPLVSLWLLSKHIFTPCTNDILITSIQTQKSHPYSTVTLSSLLYSARSANTQ